MEGPLVSGLRRETRLKEMTGHLLERKNLMSVLTPLPPPFPPPIILFNLTLTFPRTFLHPKSSTSSFLSLERRRLFIKGI